MQLPGRECNSRATSVSCRRMPIGVGFAAALPALTGLAMSEAREEISAAVKPSASRGHSGCLAINFVRAGSTPMALEHATEQAEPPANPMAWDGAME